MEKKKDKKIIQNIKESQVIIISQNEKLNNRDNKEYLIVGFEQTLIILERSTTSISFLQQILLDNPDINICFLQNTKALLIEVVEIIDFDESRPLRHSINGVFMKCDIKNHTIFIEHLKILSNKFFSSFLIYK